MMKIARTIRGYAHTLDNQFRDLFGKADSLEESVAQMEGAARAAGKGATWKSLTAGGGALGVKLILDFFGIDFGGK